jgi:hypothetical protein
MKVTENNTNIKNYEYTIRTNDLKRELSNKWKNTCIHQSTLIRIVLMQQEIENGKFNKNC